MQKTYTAMTKTKSTQNPKTREMKSHVEAYYLTGQLKNGGRVDHR